MTQLKSYTSLEQSKVLAKIIRPESADFCWGIDVETLQFNCSPYPCPWKDYTCKEYYVPCWSLAALLGIIRKAIDGYSMDCISKNIVMSVELGDRPWKLETDTYSNEIDNCYDMILKLHELNLL